MNHLIKVIFMYLCVSYATGQSFLSPCPNFFQYEFDGADWVGIMAIPSPTLGETLSVNVHLSIATQIQSQYFGRIELVSTRQEIIRDILAGRPVKYKVRFPLPQPIPKLTGIVVNNQRICSGPPAIGGVITSIKLEHTLYTAAAANSLNTQNQVNNVDENTYTPNSWDKLNNGGFAGTGNNGGKPIRPTQSPFVQKPVTPTYIRPRPQQETSSSAPPTFPQRVQGETLMAELNQICGKAKTVPNPLIINGEVTRPGDWPWMVALYTITDKGLDFTCGGTLVSHKVVISAAHCIYGLDQKQVPSNKILLILGRYNINNWTDKAIRAVVDRAVPHPEYRSNAVISDADISVLMLKNTVEFTDNIRPICLWNGPSDLERVVGREATVVGWGRDETGQKTTPEPRLAKIPIVSQETCIFSKEDFRHLTSNRTFCAGSRNGSGPCNGDSGGGLLLPQNGKWALRGIVSVSLQDQITRQCDVNEYIIFTDASKFHSWILQFMVE